MIQAETYAVHEENLSDFGSEYDPELFERLESSKELPAYKYVLAQQRRRELTTQY